MKLNFWTLNTFEIQNLLYQETGPGQRKARIGRNPATGEAIKIPAKTVVKMRPAKAAEDAIVPGKK